MNCVSLFKIYLKQMEGSVSETRCVPGGLHPPPPPPPLFASISAMKLIRILPQEPLKRTANITHEWFEIWNYLRYYF